MILYDLKSFPEGLNFDAWVASHKDETQKASCVATLTSLRDSLADPQRKAGIDLIIEEVERYPPECGAVPLPTINQDMHTDKARIIRRDNNKIVRSRSTVIRRPKTVKRVILRNPARAKK